MWIPVAAVGFVMTVYRRRLASSFEALKRTLNGRLMRIRGITEEDASLDETSDRRHPHQSVSGNRRAAPTHSVAVAAPVRRVGIARPGRARCGAPEIPRRPGTTGEGC